MKRIALFLAYVLLSLTLCSCSAEPAANTSLHQSGQQQTEQTENSAAAQADSRYVLCDTSDCTVTVTSIDHDPDEKSCIICVQYENHSDRALLFRCSYASVNRWASTASWSYTVNPGDSFTETIVLDSSSMNGHEITSVDRLSFSLYVYDAEDFYADTLVDETFTFYPTGLTDEQIVVPERRHIAGETVIVNDDNVEFVIMEIGKDSGGAVICCYIENKTDEFIDFMWENTAVNGWKVTPEFYQAAVPHSRFYVNIIPDQELLNLCGIEQVDELTFDMLAYPTFDFSADAYVRDSFRVLPTGLSENELPTPERTPVAGEQVILNKANLTIILDPLCTRDGNIFMNLYIRNGTDDVINVNMDGFFVNNSEEISCFVYETVPSGHHLYYPVKIEESILNGMDIDDVESIQCNLDITDPSFTENMFHGHIGSSF